MQINDTISWGDVGIYIVQGQLNKRPSRATGNYSPYEAFYGQAPKSSPENFLSPNLLRLCQSEDGLNAAYELVKSSNGKATDEELKSAIEQGEQVYEQFIASLSASSNGKRSLPEGDATAHQDTGKKIRSLTASKQSTMGKTVETIIVPAKPFNKSTAFTRVHRNSSRKTRGKNLSRSQIIKNVLSANQIYNFQYPRIKCGCCFSGSHLLSIGDETYLDDNENTSRWWDSDFISTFATLVNHHHHRSKSANFVSTMQLIHCSWPKSIPEESECRDLNSDINTIISVLHGIGHFCVMEIDLNTRVIAVTDGLGFPLKTWTDHAINILRRCKIYNRDEDMFTPEVDNALQLHDAGGYRDDLDFVMVAAEDFLPQLDNFNCGPIACLKIMSAYGDFDPNEDAIEPKNYRSWVIERFRHLVRLYGSDLLQLTPPSVSGNSNDSMIDHQVVCGICHDTVPGHPMTSMVCCKKEVHAYCIAQWLDNHSSCIYCRAEVSSITVDGAVIPFESTSGAALIDSKVNFQSTKKTNAATSPSFKTAGTDSSFSTSPSNGDPEVHESDINDETAQIRAKMRVAQRHSAKQVNDRRSKSAYSQTLAVGDICNVKVEGNVRAATDAPYVPVAITAVHVTPSGKSVKYSVASKHGHLQGKFTRERLEHCPGLDMKIMSIDLKAACFKRKKLEVHQASALFNKSGGGSFCKCEIRECSTNPNCTCKYYGRFCTSKCHKGRGNARFVCKLLPPPGNQLFCQEINNSTLEKE